MNRLPPHCQRIFRNEIVLLTLLILFFLPQGLLAVVRPTFPVTNNGKKWRIGYYEGGSYINYPANLKALAEGLVQLGWLKKSILTPIASSEDSKEIWAHLANTPGPYLDFNETAFWSANWDNGLRDKQRARIIDLLQKRQIDFMIAMGTWAGQDLANSFHKVPVMVVSSSNPVLTRIVKSPFDSGLDHVHARCDPKRYKRQMRLFYSIFGFKRLGLVYENSLEGRSYAALEDVVAVARENGFKVLTCEAPFSRVPQGESTQGIIKCHQELSSKIDAFFVTIHRGIDLARMDAILAPLIEKKVPTWSQRGPQEVERGVLMSIARREFKAVGRFHAEVMAKILNGARPRDLNQIFQDPKAIAINLKTADAIGFDPPKGLMKVVDEIYR